MKKITSDASTASLHQTFWRWISFSVFALIVAAAFQARSADVFIDEGDGDFGATPVSSPAANPGDKAPASAADVPPAGPGGDLASGSDAQLDLEPTPGNPSVTDLDIPADSVSAEKVPVGDAPVLEKPAAEKSAAEKSPEKSAVENPATEKSFAEKSEPSKKAAKAKSGTKSTSKSSSKSPSKSKDKKTGKSSKKKDTKSKKDSKKTSKKDSKKSSKKSSKKNSKDSGKQSKKSSKKKTENAHNSSGSKAGKRKVAAFFGGQYATTAKACSMESAPGAGDSVGTTAKARKLWVEDAGNTSYWKVYGKSGAAAYVARDCFE